MTPTTALLTAWAAVIIPFATACAQVPDITGRWKVDSQIVELGDSPQWPHENDPTHVEEREFHPHLIIDRVDGDRFWGRFVSSTRTQNLVGVFTGEDTRFMIAFEFGTGIGRVTSADKLRWCYAQPTSAAARAQIAGCNDATRE